MPAGGTAVATATMIVYAVLSAAVFLLLLVSFQTSSTQQIGRRVAPHGHQVTNPPAFLGWESGARGRQEKTWERGLVRRRSVAERLDFLFPMLDRSPKDGRVSLRELEVWNKRRAVEELATRAERQMQALDRDGDGAVSLHEYLHRMSIEEIDENSMERGQAGWLKELFELADSDGNGSLNHTEFNNFLHPEDSRDIKIKKWLQKERLRKIDQDKDGRLSFVEFCDQIYEKYKFHFEFEKSIGGRVPVLLPEPEVIFSNLDVNKDKFLTSEELSPIIQYLEPGEVSHASFYTMYMMREADDDKDGTLTLDEILEHDSILYDIVSERERLDDYEVDEYHYDHHRYPDDEL